LNLNILNNKKSKKSKYEMQIGELHFKLVRTKLGKNISHIKRKYQYIEVTRETQKSNAHVFKKKQVE
jgi:hypothetical protein